VDGDAGNRSGDVGGRNDRTSWPADIAGAVGDSFEEQVDDTSEAQSLDKLGVVQKLSCAVSGVRVVVGRNSRSVPPPLPFSSSRLCEVS
jgi:hypothetical protein